MTVMTNRSKTLADSKLGESKVSHITGRMLRLRYKKKAPKAAESKAQPPPSSNGNSNGFSNRKPGGSSHWDDRHL